jgi:hypothetical protein
MFHSNGFNDWFEGSAFKDENGRPKTLYHATDCDENFNIFAVSEEGSLGYHFGSLDSATERLRVFDRTWNGKTIKPLPMAGSIIPVVCNAQNPLRLRDHHLWGTSSVAHELLDMGVISEEQYDYITEEFEDQSTFAAIEMAGFDCIIYRNETEHSGTPSDSLIIWRAEQVKSIYSSTFDRSSPYLSEGHPAKEADFQQWIHMAKAIEEHKHSMTRLMRQLPSELVTLVF